MALFTCPECKKKISEHAAACPNCGAPVVKAQVEAQRKQGKVGLIVTIVVIVGFVAMCSNHEKKTASTSSSAASSVAAKKKNDDEMTEIKMQRLVRGFVTASLKDPDSAQFRNQKGGCGEVNAKNSFGGYSGFKRFIASGKDMVFMEGDPALAPGAFQEAWNKVCK